MSKKFDDQIKVHISKDVDEIFDVMKRGRIFHEMRELPYPFHQELLKLLNTANPLDQTYYYIEQEERYAFFTVYENRMDLLTYGKAQWFMNVQTIGFPCSLSSPGYLTNDLVWMLAFIKTIKGCKLVLNVDQKVETRGMAFGETLPTCKLTLRPEHTSLEGYLNSLRSPYRRRIHLAEKQCRDIEVRRSSDSGIDVYPLYLQTYEKSDYKLECLEQEFFDRADGEKLVFLRGETPVGFVLLKVNGTELIFMFCGMEYREEEIKNPDLYFYMLLQIVDYAISHHCKTIDFGQTSEKTKMKFGAVLQKKYFYAHHTNPFLNLIALLGRHILEYTYQFPEFHVFKSEPGEKDA